MAYVYVLALWAGIAGVEAHAESGSTSDKINNDE